MTRILFLDHTPFIGGAQLALAEHIRLLDRDRFEPLVGCTSEVPALVDRFRAAGAEVHFTPLPRLRSLSPLVLPRALHAAWELRRLVRRERVDLIVANTSRAAYIASIAFPGAGVPLVWWVRDFDFGRASFRALSSVPRRVVSVSEAIRDFYGGEGERFPVVVVGTDLHRRLADHTDAQLLGERARWGIGPADRVVGYMGRLVEGKGPQDLLEAFQAVRAEHPDLRLLVVGTGRNQEGDVEAALHEEVRRRGLSRAVAFAGFQTDEALFYRLFDVFVLSTRIREAMPTSVIQAMMAGLPVVATATGGTPEVVVDGETGLLVPPADPAALADALRKLLGSPAEAGRLAEAGRSLALRRHQEETTTREVESIYAQVLGERGGAPARRGRAAVVAARDAGD